MKRCLTLVVGAACLSCATRADLALLDSLRSPGEASWMYYKGSSCDFKHEAIVCVSAVDDGTRELAVPYRRIDLTRTVVEFLKHELPGLTYSCHDSDRRIRAEYQGGYSFATHSDPPHLGSRFGLAFVRVESPQGWIADVVWTDTRGGSAEEVSLRFSSAFAKFLADARSTRCD